METIRFVGSLSHEEWERQVRPAKKTSQEVICIHADMILAALGMAA